MDARIITGKSQKTGKEYKCIEVKVGVYSGRLFPSPAEVKYLEDYLRNKAHEDFSSPISEKD